MVATRKARSKSVTSKGRNADQTRRLRVRITQVFASADNEQVISEIEIAPDEATPVPVAGDNVRWVVKGKVYEGRVKSRLISYSAPDNIGLDTANEVNIKAVLRVELGA
jgi:hypothetical protein